MAVQAQEKAQRKERDQEKAIGGGIRTEEKKRGEIEKNFGRSFAFTMKRLSIIRQSLYRQVSKVENVKLQMFFLMDSIKMFQN